MPTKVKSMSFYRNISQWTDLNVFKWSKNYPIFALNSEQIEIIENPNDFFNKLKVCLKYCLKILSENIV